MKNLHRALSASFLFAAAAFSGVPVLAGTIQTTIQLTSDGTLRTVRGNTLAELFEAADSYWYGPEGTDYTFCGDFYASGNFIGVSNEEHSGISSLAFVGHDVSFTSCTESAICWLGEIRLSGKNTFVNNRGEVGQYASFGGALSNAGNSIILSGENIFDGNAAVSSGGSAYGGAIHADSVDGISGSVFLSGKNKFTNNRAEGRNALGGAIYSIGGNVTLSGKGEFSGNSAISSGDIVYGGAVSGGSFTLTEGRVEFTDNRAESATYAYGGAVWGRSVTLSGEGKFSGNMAISSEYSAFGGAVSGGSFTLTEGRVEFTDNRAESATYARGGAVSGNSVTLSGEGIFEGNMAVSSGDGAYSGGASGGAIYNNGSVALSGEMEFSGNMAISNGYSAFGGAVYTEFFTLSEGRAEFTNNRAEGATYAYGGAIYSNHVNGGNVTLSGEGEFSGNVAISNGYGSDARGGAIYTEFLTLSEGKFTFANNHAECATEPLTEACGGAVYGGVSLFGDVVFDGNAAISSSGNARGGAISRGMAAYVVTLSEGKFTFTNNRAEGAKSACGGAVYGSGTSVMLSGECIFEGNMAVSSGSGVYSGDASGGAIFGGDSGSVTLSGEGLFDGNSAVSSGGSASGGAVYGSFTLTEGGVEFTDNRSEGATYARGGAVWGSVVLSGEGVFSGNMAVSSGGSAEGGAISGNVTLSGGKVTFTDNWAEGATIARGGAIYASSDGVSISGESTFRNNTASGALGAYGGAIYSGCGQILFFGDGSSAVFEGNTANGQGNDIYSKGGDVTIRDAGTYYFGGGIVVETTEASAAIFSVSGGAEVTFASGATNRFEGAAVITGAGTRVSFENAMNRFNGGLTVSDSATASFEGQYDRHVFGSLNVESGANVTFASGSGNRIEGATAITGAGTQVFFENRSNENDFNGDVTVSGGASASFGRWTVNDFAGSLMVSDGAMVTFDEGAKTDIDGAVVVSGEGSRVSFGNRMNTIKGGLTISEGAVASFAVHLGGSVTLSSLVNEGTIILRNGSLAPGVSSIVFNDYGKTLVAGGNVLAFGGTYADGVFTAGAENIRFSDVDSSTTVAAGTSLEILSGDFSVTLSAAGEDFVVNVARALDRESVVIDTGNAGDKTLAAWSFDIDNGAGTDKSKILVVLNVGQMLDGSTIKIFHRGDGEDAAWEDYTDTVDFLSYNAESGELSFLTSDFSSYAATGSALSIPEPSAFGLLAGLGTLALVASRRRRKKRA